MSQICLPVICILAGLSVGAPARVDEAGFISLFDGKTLKGWTINCLPKDKEQAAKAWTVDRGTILANSMGHTKHFYILLATKEEYGDFVLRLRIQVERGVTVVDYDGSGVLHDELHKKHNVGTKGLMGLQLHSFHQLHLRFKDIRIKAL